MSVIEEDKEPFAFRDEFKELKHDLVNRLRIRNRWLTHLRLILVVASLDSSSPECSTADSVWVIKIIDDLKVHQKFCQVIKTKPDFYCDYIVYVSKKFATNLQNRQFDELWS